jgi:hypothetical protein
MKSILNSSAILLAFLLATSAFAGPVSHYGALKVCKVGGKGQLCGSKPGTTTTPVLVKGPSLYWSVYPGHSFYSPDAVEWLVTEMEIGVIRAAMAIRYWDGGQDLITKLDGSGSSIKPYALDKDGQKVLIKRVIDAAIENDIYVIVDWHSHVAHDETTLARDFFVEIANEYKNVPNIIWEVYNEPINASASQITSHSNTIINALRAANVDNKNLVLVGSRDYSKQPYSQAQDMFGNNGSDNAVSKNVAFTFHFYAASHPQSGEIGTNAANAMNAGYAVFGSEWGSMNYDGAGSVNSSATGTWTNWMDANNISNCAWQASALDETSSMFSSGTFPSNLASNRLTENGRLIKTYVSNANRWFEKIPDDHPTSRDVVKSVKDKDGVLLTLTATDLGLRGNITEVSQPAFGTVSKTDNSITFTAPSNGTESDVVRFVYKVTQNNVTVQSWVKINITDRRPFLQQKDPIDVSRKAPTTLAAIGTLSAQNPGTGLLSFSETSSLSNPSVGTLSVNGSNLIFTPAPSQANTELTEVTLNYTIQNTNGSSSAAVVLRLKNSVPTLNPPNGTGCCLTGNNNSKPNTAPIDIRIEQVRGADKDGDDLWFDTLYLDTQNYPGTLTKVSQDHYVYTPDPNKIGKVVFLAYITDGEAVSSLGKTYLTLTGNGSAIPDHPDGNNGPNSIPGITPIASNPGTGSLNLGIKSLGSGRVALSFAESGFAKLDVYSLSGKNMGTLLNGHQNVGQGEVSLSKLGLQKGVYILRLKQGSQVKILRIVN